VLYQVGKVFKAAKFLGAGKNVARAASGLQSAARWNMTGLHQMRMQRELIE